MTSPRRIFAALLPLAAALLLVNAACFSKSLTFQASSESSSKSLSSPFKSSSESSSPEEKAASDVSDVAALWALREDSVANLRREVGRTTERYGVTDWENDPVTYRAIGRGLKRSGIEARSFEAIKTELAAGDAAVLAWIETGYAADGTF